MSRYLDDHNEDNAKDDNHKKMITLIKIILMNRYLDNHNEDNAKDDGNNDDSRH